jgi:hypothetical protein
MMGGKSKASMDLVSPGADGTKGALQVTGEVLPGGKYPWAGVMFAPGSSPNDPANLSSKKEIRFWAKGDGGGYTLLMLTARRNGQNGIPAMTTFVAGPEWKQYVFPFATFETDGSDITSLLFVRLNDAGKFSFQIDQDEIR